MRKDIIKALVKLNIMYSADQSTITKFRNRKKANPYYSIPKAIIVPQLGLGVVIGIVFLLMALLMHIDKKPQMFGQFVFFFVVLSFVQGFLVMFNVFFESRDLQAYRHLPVTNAEIILGKSLTVITGTIIYLLPLGIMLIIAPFKVMKIMKLKLVFAALNLGFVLVGTLLMTFMIVSWVTSTRQFKKHKKLLSQILTGVASVLLAISFLALNTSLPIYGFLKEHPAIYGMLTKIILFEKEPTIIGFIHSFAPWTVIIIISIIYIKKWSLPNFYSQMDSLGNAGKGSLDKKIRAACSKNDGLRGKRRINSILLKYHFGLLGDTHIVTQMIVMPQLILPAIMLFSMTETLGRIASAEFTFSISPAFVLAGGFYALISSGNLHFIIISLDRENYNYIKSLPFNFYDYIMYKFWFAFIVQSIIPISVMVIISVVFRVPIQLLIFALIAFITVSIMMSDMAFKKDYKFLDLNWGSTAQLSNRDGNNIKRMLILIGGIVVVIIITAIIYSVASVILAKTGIVVSLAITLALMVTSFLYHRSSLKFWKSEL